MTTDPDPSPANSAANCTTRCEFHSSLLNFRPIGHQDLELMYQWRSDQQQSRFLLAPAPQGVEQQKKWYEKVKDDPSCVYYMTFRASDPEHPFGYTSITKIDAQTSSAEFGVVIGSHQDVGKGQSFYLGGSLLTIAFRCLGLSHLYSSCHPENTLANRAVERLGGELVAGPSPYRKGEECLRVHTPDTFAERVQLEQERFPGAEQAFDLSCTDSSHQCHISDQS